MNYPGVAAGDAEVLAKLSAARVRGKPIDGHAPGLRGAALAAYVAAGISTDHECVTEEEALEKLSLGMKILIREGSPRRRPTASPPSPAASPTSRSPRRRQRPVACCG